MKTPEEIAREILVNATKQFHEDFPGCALPDSLRPDIANAIRTERTAADELRKGNTRLFTFAKKAVEALRNCAYGGHCNELDNQGTPCGLCTDGATAILTDPICIELMKEKV